MNQWYLVCFKHNFPGADGYADIDDLDTYSQIKFDEYDEAEEFVQNSVEKLYSVLSKNSSSESCEGRWRGTALFDSVEKGRAYPGVNYVIRAGTFTFWWQILAVEDGVIYEYAPYNEEGEEETICVN